MTTHSTTKRNKIMKIIKSTDGKNVLATDKQAETIELLQSCRNGGMATVHGYKPSTRVIEEAIYDINMLTKINVAKLYERKMEALQKVDFAQVAELAQKDDKLKLLTAGELLKVYQTRITSEIASMQKTLDGIRDDAHRKAHDAYYAHFGQGVKANVKQLDNGNYEIKSIMLPYVEMNRKVIKKGSYKTVNSGCPVRVSNIIKKLTNQKSHGLKTLSLKEDNFTSLRIDRKTFDPEGLNESVKGEFNRKMCELVSEYGYLVL